MKLVSPTGHKKITLQENEHVEILLEDFKPGSRKFTLEVELVGQNAHCEISGRAQTSKQDTKEWTITQKFLGKNQTGRIELRGVAEDKSFLKFDGSVVLEKVSRNADAKISERIMLFDKGRGKLLPILTVKTDNVRSASHSASIAPAEEEKILFLTSRGIPKKESEKMIKEGFLKC